MFLKMLKSKIHGVRVTEANLNYVGSITIDRDLIDAAGLVPNQEVLVTDVNNGNRLTTYVLEGERGSGVICMNGAAARLIHEGDIVLVLAYVYMTPEEAADHTSTILIMDPEKNTVKETLRK